MAGPRLAYEHLNLRRNPFGELPREERAAVAVVPREYAHWLSAPCRQRRALLFVGDAGRGKSTHLIAVHAGVPPVPFTYVGEGERPRIPNAPLVFVDELQRIPRWRRAQLFRRRASFALSSHRDHTRELLRAGVAVRTVRVGGLDASRLQAVTTRRIEVARRAPGPLPRLGPEAASALVARFGDDLRAIEGHLYEVFQDLKEVGDVPL